MITTLSIDLRLLTPAFLGGAGPGAELRAPSIKGTLRFWYRAIDPAFKKHEARLFGGTTGTGVGQSAVLLRVDAEPFNAIHWDRQRIQPLSEGQGKFARNGLIYLGFPLQLPGNLDRTAVPADTRFTLRVVVPRPPKDARDRRAILAALWMFALCGSLGMRSRRGFGSLALENWTIEGADADAWKNDMDRLQNPNTAGDAKGWEHAFEAGRATIRSWLEGEEPAGTGASWGPNPKHPHLGPKSDFRLSTGALEPPATYKSKGNFKPWEVALFQTGLQLQSFRLRRQPDYDNVKEHLRFRSREGGVKIKAVPERAAFGLPLAFRYSSLKTRVTSTIFVPHNPGTQAGTPLERHPSPLLLKLVSLPDGLHAFWLRLDGPRPGTFPRAGERGAPAPLAPPATDLVGDFLKSL